MQRCALLLREKPPGFTNALKSWMSRRSGVQIFNHRDAEIEMLRPQRVAESDVSIPSARVAPGYFGVRGHASFERLARRNAASAVSEPLFVITASDKMDSKARAASMRLSGEMSANICSKKTVVTSSQEEEFTSRPLASPKKHC